MKITRRQLRRIIKEALEVHQVPVDLDTVDSEEAYGIGYMKGAEQPARCQHRGDRYQVTSQAKMTNENHTQTIEADHTRGAKQSCAVRKRNEASQA